MQVSSIGVVGAGQMGAVIAQVSACAGFSVTLVDIKADVIESGIASIRSSLARIVSKGRLDQKTSDEALDRIQTALDLGDLAECDLVVEAIPEVLDLKTSTFNRLDAICKPSTILASNTSSISINTIAEFTSRPERVIGMHFMNPVPIMKLVEVINGTHTTEIVTSEVISVIEALGKTPLQCNDSPGFVSNRILCPMINEAIITLDEGVAEVEAIDGIMKLGMNHPIGPLALADLIGLDTVLNIMRVLHEGLGEEKYAPSPLLVSMVSEGKLGRKTKIGFYKY